MKILKIIIVLYACSCVSKPVEAQTINWNALGTTRHVLHANAGLDYGMAYAVAYAYRQESLLMGASLSVSSGEHISDDFKTKMGAQLLVLNKKHFKGSIALHGVFRGYENDLAHLRNFGAETKGVAGLYKQRWFIAGEIGFDKAIVTHFKHTEVFKQYIYRQVKDGWYQPSTGGNLNYGIQTGFSSKRIDLTLALGKLLSEDLRTAPLLPFYTTLGINYKF